MSLLLTKRGGIQFFRNFDALCSKIQFLLRTKNLGQLWSKFIFFGFIVLFTLNPTDFLILIKNIGNRTEPKSTFTCIFLDQRSMVKNANAKRDMDAHRKPRSFVAPISKKIDKTLSKSALKKVDKAKKEAIANELITLIGCKDDAFNVKVIRNCIRSGLPMFIRTTFVTCDGGSVIEEGKPVVIHHLHGRQRSSWNLSKIPLESCSSLSKVHAFIEKHWPSSSKWIFQVALIQGKKEKLVFHLGSQNPIKVH